jgi:hypothetical protein
MKVIYMEQTILLMSKIDPQGTERVIASGTIKQDQNNKPYLVTIVEDGE